MRAPALRGVRGWRCELIDEASSARHRGSGRPRLHHRGLVRADALFARIALDAHLYRAAEIEEREEALDTHAAALRAELRARRPSLRHAKCAVVELQRFLQRRGGRGAASRRLRWRLDDACEDAVPKRCVQLLQLLGHFVNHTWFARHQGLRVDDHLLYFLDL